MSAESTNCGEQCRATLLGLLAKHGIEATVTLTPPLIDTGYEQLDMRCPHGREWFIEPTGEQRDPSKVLAAQVEADANFSWTAYPSDHYERSVA